MDLGLKDKVAVITGASIGIGLAVAEGLAAEGVHLVMVARQQERLQSETERLAEKFGVKTTAVSCDVATSAGVDEIVAAAKNSFGGADILINNAGTGSNETVMEAPDEKWQFYWDLHVMAAVRLARGLVPFMRERGGGAILHNASICAIQPLWYEPIYNVTKAALMMFSKTLSLELDQRQYPGEHDKSRPHPHPRLEQDRQHSSPRTKAATGRAIWTPLPKSTLPSPASPHPRNLRTFSCSSVRTARATRWDRPTSLMAACSRSSPEPR